jgi:diadenosine tetraphosphatase ApaH/serine/threonine PP2A family protein phosphatase
VLEARQVDYIACLGDVVGYGGQPEECCTLVRKYADVTVLGNHDAAVARRMDYDYYRPAARLALDLHRQLLSPANLSWLTGLSYVETLGDLAFCHGVPPDYEAFEYLFALEQVGQLCETYEQQARVTFVGHSHLCKSFRYNATAGEEILRTRFRANGDSKYIISAGSVGQPRDYDSRACCAVYDTDDGLFEYIRLAYDIDGAARRIAEANLSETFGRRLFLGV